MEVFTPREQIIEVVNRLFIYTDNQQWDHLKKEVFADEVYMDMSSLGGPKNHMSSGDICEMWEEGFKDIDSVNHLGGNYLVDLHKADSASVLAYATATHYKENATKGKTREFVGTYNLELLRAENGWRITAFSYNLKYLNGNLDLE